MADHPSVAVWPLRDTGRVTFQHAVFGSGRTSEAGCLGLLAGAIVAILVRCDRDEADGPGWYLNGGFGRCDREGLMFGSLGEAEDWICAQYQPPA